MLTSVQKNLVSTLFELPPLEFALGLLASAELQAELDEVDLGQLDDESRAEARGKRKALTGRLEAELMPGLADLRAALARARKAVDE